MTQAERTEAALDACINKTDTTDEERRAYEALARALAAKLDAVLAHVESVKYEHEDRCYPVETLLADLRAIVEAE